MKRYIKIIEEAEGLKLAKDAGSTIQYVTVVTRIGDLDGFINPRESMRFRPDTIYVSKEDLEALVNKDVQ